MIFWSEKSSLVKHCSRLLLKLSDCVAERHCQHYFISSCNLLDYFVEDDSWILCNDLRILADESVLLSWFVKNYRVGHKKPSPYMSVDYVFQE